MANHTDAREEHGNPRQDDRKHNSLLVFGAGITAYLLFGLALWLLLDWYISPQDSTQKKDLIQALSLIMAGVAGAIGVYATWQNFQQGKESLQVARAGQKSTEDSTRRSLELSQKGQITERFTKAVDQLGDDKIQIRLGGIFALERIAEDSKEYHWPVIEVLTACVREQAAYTPARKKEGRADIQAIVNAIGHLTRRYGAREDSHVVDLNNADLFGLDLSEAHLEGALLFGSHLERGRLDSARLEEADLRAAHFNGANLYGVDLKNADLRGAHLDGAHLSGEQIELAGADLGGADLKTTDVGETDLRGVKNLVREQIEQANGDWQTKLPIGLQVPAWWSNLPTAEGPLPPGDYSVRVGRTVLSFDVGEGWNSVLRASVNRQATFLT
jgi:hypothetical protein